MRGVARWGGGHQDEAQCFQLVILHSNITYINIVRNTFTFICVFFFRFLGACGQHTTKCHLHMGISPGDRGVMNSLFNPTCCLLPPLSLTKLELCRHFLHKVTGSLLPCWFHAQMPVTKSYHSLWKEICISRHYIDCLVFQPFCRMPRQSIECLFFQSFYRMSRHSIE